MSDTVKYNEVQWQLGYEYSNPPMPHFIGNSDTVDLARWDQEMEDHETETEQRPSQLQPKAEPEMQMHVEADPKPGVTQSSHGARAPTPRKAMIACPLDDFSGVWILDG